MHIDRHNQHVQLDIRDPAFYQDPYPTYHALRQQAPIFYWENHNLWALTRHEDVDNILRDRRFGRQITHVLSRETLGWPPRNPAHQPFWDAERFSLLNLEPPAHTRLRGLVQKAFMARQIERLRPRIVQLNHDLIDQMQQRPSANLLTDFATPIPVTVIAEMLGVPTTMNDQLLAWSHSMVKMYELERTAHSEATAVAAARDFVAYLRDYVALRRTAPRDDLISHLIQVEEAGETLTEDELICTCILLLNAGHEATVNVIGNGVYALLQNRAQLERWQQDERLTTTAVAELLRYDTPLHQFNRWALQDIVYKGHHWPQGTEVSLLLGAANRDPAQFPAPDRLDLGRQPNRHLSFGGGIHYCLGAPLARLELEIALTILHSRLPHLTLAQPPTVTNTYHFRGLSSLWVTW